MKNAIEIPAGSTIDEVVNELLAANARGEFAYCEFNGYKLYSDTVSMDTAYKKITGKTKAEFVKFLEECEEKYRNKKNYEEEVEEWLTKYNENQEILEKKAYDNIPNWINQGNNLIFPERYEKWAKCVQERVEYLYHGRELDAALEIMESLEKNISMEKAIEIFEGQIHSGDSSFVVRNIVFNFSIKGPEFYEATAHGKLPLDIKEIIVAKKQENEQLKQINMQKTLVKTKF